MCPWRRLRNIDVVCEIDVRQLRARKPPNVSRQSHDTLFLSCTGSTFTRTTVPFSAVTRMYDPGHGQFIHSGPKAIGISLVDYVK